MSDKYRKKPLVIEAMRVPTEKYTFVGPGNDQGLTDWGNLAVWLGPGGDWELQPDGITIRTLEGIMLASPGDWIIRGVKGELYPCKADVFEATYEKVAVAEPTGHLGTHVCVLPPGRCPSDYEEAPNA